MPISKRVGSIALRLRLAYFVAAALVLASAIARADEPNPLLMPSAPLHERLLRLPGDPLRPVSLQVTLFTPPGPGPFPLAVMNHGASAVSSDDRGPRYRYTYAAYYFLSRGYAVALPMARGFAGCGGGAVGAGGGRGGGGGGGVWAAPGCDLDAVGLANARDLNGAIDALGRQPGIDRTRVIVAGQSFGGWTAMALGTLAVPGVRGIIGFSPALRASDCLSQDQAMIAGARSFGRAARLPSLWFYGDNDAVMPVATWRAVFDAYARGSGRSELVPVGRFLLDSHQMLSFPESLAIWTSRVDGFLARIGLPATETYPEYLPLPTPPPSHAAALEDVAAVPFLNDKGLQAYRAFLARSIPRAFVLGPEGTYSVANGGFDPLARALAGCRTAGVACSPYAVDFNVVWSGRADAVATYARDVPAGATAVLDFASAINPDCSSRGLPKLWVSRLPEHGTASVFSHGGHPHFPSGSPYAVCNATLVPGVVVTYTPGSGYSGADAVEFQETDVDGRHRNFRVALTVR